uniref:Ovule protein n=1 Tax=Mesocestoides corti TaxID=53468 RepID=A0A5K3G2K7_MESCO
SQGSPCHNISPAVRILNSLLIPTKVYLEPSSYFGLDVNTSRTHASEVQIHTHKWHPRHCDTNVVEF